MWVRVILFAALALAGCHAGPKPDKERDVAHPFDTQTQELTLAGREVSVDIYVPQRRPTGPIVVVAHGFTATRKNMSGWGEHLAEAGFVTVVPDLPYWSDHKRNSQAVKDLARMIEKGEISGLRADSKRLALVGFSAGGLATFIAAAQDPKVACWIGLDPVDSDEAGQRIASSVKCPSLMLRARSSQCNKHANSKRWADDMPNCRMEQIPDASHCDIEDPANPTCRLACGQRDPDRHHAFVRQTIRFLKEQLGRR